MFGISKQDLKFEKDNVYYYRVIFRDTNKIAALHQDLYPGYKLAKHLYVKMSGRESSKTSQLSYQLLIAGDPKKRSYRAILGAIYRERGGGI